jgi:hypothetical protein
MGEDAGQGFAKRSCDEQDREVPNRQCKLLAKRDGSWLKSCESKMGYE